MVGEIIGRTVPLRLSREGRILTIDITPIELTTS
jgi:hypothetical protein